MWFWACGQAPSFPFGPLPPRALRRSTNDGRRLSQVNTGQEFDGSDSGARPDEAISWGKIKAEATPVKVYAEATIIMPLLVAQTFARE